MKVISIIGSGNWGTTIAKIIASNLSKKSNFDQNVHMWVREEIIGERKLSAIINEDHENVKYLPNIQLPSNVIADPDLVKCTQIADILVFVLPHQFVEKTVEIMKPNVKANAHAISLIKGIIPTESKSLLLVSDVIKRELSIPCAVLMGANLAGEVANEFLCEATIGCKDPSIGKELKSLFQTNFFRIAVVEDEVGVELCGALKNVVALGVGFVEGLGHGENTKAIAIRLGFVEMTKFIMTFYQNDGVTKDTLSESCGIADLVASSYGGRNKRLAVEFAKSNKSIAELEKEILQGQKAQGPLTAAEVNVMLAAKGLEKEYPVFTSIHKICSGQAPCSILLECMRNHPVHL